MTKRNTTVPIDLVEMLLLLCGPFVNVEYDKSLVRKARPTMIELRRVRRTQRKETTKWRGYTAQERFVYSSYKF